MLPVKFPGFKIEDTCRWENREHMTTKELPGRELDFYLCWLCLIISYTKIRKVLAI